MSEDNDPIDNEDSSSEWDNAPHSELPVSLNPRPRGRDAILDDPDEDSDDKSTAIKDAADTDNPYMIAIDLEVDHNGMSVYLKGQSSSHTTLPPVVIVHDFGANSSHYRCANKFLLDAGFSTYSFDLRGHGRSGGSLGHIEKFDDLIQDLLQVAAWVKHREGGRSPVVIAHGLGALVAMGFHSRYPRFCRALVLVAPSIRLQNSFSRTSRLIVQTLADIYPKWKLPLAFTPRFYSILKPGLAPEGSTLRLIPTFTRVSSQFGTQIFRALESAPYLALRLKAPTQVILAEKDLIAENQTTINVFARHKHQKLLKIESVADGGHNLISENEPSLEDTMTRITGWIKALDQSSDSEKFIPSNVGES